MTPLRKRMIEDMTLTINATASPLEMVMAQKKAS